MAKIIILDFAGTLVKRSIIEDANKLRSKILQRAIPTRKEHANSEKLYLINRKFVEKLTGVTGGMRIKYRENDLNTIEMRGDDVQNQISSNIFQIGMYMAAKKHKKGIMPNGMISQLKRMKRLGFKLAIVSGVRTDIISGMFNIAGIPVKFDYIYGQPPKLGVKNQDYAIKELKSKGTIRYVIGDKLSDFERVSSRSAKTIFVKGGHPSGGEESFADYTITNMNQLGEIIK